MSEGSVEYLRYIENCSKEVQFEMSLGNIKSVDGLKQHIENVSSILCPFEAFEIFEKRYPNGWKEYVSSHLLRKHKFDIKTIILQALNDFIKLDVLSIITNTDGFRFLKGDKSRKALVINGNLGIVFTEIWRSEVQAWDYLPPVSVFYDKGKEISLYHEGVNQNPVYVLEHEDPTLSWVSELVILNINEKVAEYEKIKCCTLEKYKCPRNNFWLTEVQTKKDFASFYKDTIQEDPIEYYELNSYHFVIYYHESGEVHCHAGFNDKTEFEQACSFISKRFKGK